MLSIEISSVKCQFCLRVDCNEHSEKDLIPAPFNKMFWAQYLHREINVWIRKIDLTINSGYKFPQFFDLGTTDFSMFLDLDRANQQYGTNNGYNFRKLEE